MRSLVERDPYLRGLYRYVVPTPVGAHTVGQAGDWPWSNAGLDSPAAVARERLGARAVCDGLCAGSRRLCRGGRRPAEPVDRTAPPDLPRQRRIRLAGSPRRAAEQQASLLRCGQPADADVEHFAEEIETLGANERRELESRLKGGCSTC
jgi:hypothetical protein